MQRSKRPRLSNEGPLEVLSSVPQRNPGRQPKLTFKALPAEDDSQGHTHNRTGAASELGPKAFPQAKRLASTSQADAPGGVQVAGAISHIRPVAKSAAGAQFGSALVAFPRPAAGALPPNQPQAQRRVWLRSEPHQYGALAAAGTFSGAQPSVSAQPVARSTPAELLAMQRRLHRQGRLVLQVSGSTSGLAPAAVPRPLNSTTFPASNTAAPAAGAAAALLPPQPSPPWAGVPVAPKVASAPTTTQRTCAQASGPSVMPPTHNTRRVWVRRAGVSDPVLTSCTAAAAAAAACARASPSAGADPAAAAAGTESTPIVTGGVALPPWQPRLTAARSTSNLRSGNITAGPGVGGRPGGLSDGSGESAAAATAIAAATAAARVGRPAAEVAANAVGHPASAAAATSSTGVAAGPAAALSEALPIARAGASEEGNDGSNGGDVHGHTPAEDPWPAAARAATIVGGEPSRANLARARAHATTAAVAAAAAATAGQPQPSLVIQLTSAPQGVTIAKRSSATPRIPAKEKRASQPGTATLRASAQPAAVAATKPEMQPAAATLLLLQRAAGPLPATAAAVAATRLLLARRSRMSAEANRKQSLTRKGAAATAAAAPPAARPSPPGAQYLRPGRHKLVRKAATAAALPAGAGVQSTTRSLTRSMVATMAAAVATAAAPATASGRECSVMALRAAAPGRAPIRVDDCGGSCGGARVAGIATGPGTGPGTGGTPPGVLIGAEEGVSKGSCGSGGRCGRAASASGSGAPRQALTVVEAVTKAAAQAGNQHGAAAYNAPVPSPQRSLLGAQRPPGFAATVIGAGALSAAAAVAARLRAAAAVQPRRGQLTWRRRAGIDASALAATDVAVAASRSRGAGVADPWAATDNDVSASTSTMTATSGAAVPTSSVTSPPLPTGGEVPKRRPGPILLRMGRSKLRPVAAAGEAPTQSVSSASASALDAAAAAEGSALAGATLARARCYVWPASRPGALAAAGRRPARMLHRHQQHRQRKAFANSSAAVWPGGRSLKLVTVNGQQFYAAERGDARGGGVREGSGMCQLHSISSIAGKAAAAAAAAAARRPQPTATARRVAIASQAVRKAVWRRRGLDPTSPTVSAAAAAAAARRRSLLGMLTRPATVAMPAVAVASARARKVASGSGRGGGCDVGSIRAAAAQRILAKARMRRAAAQATKARGYCPDYCRTGVCSLSRDPAGGRCPYTHDPTKVAVCARWLACSCTTVDCHLQHRRLPDLMSLCTYFLQGKCTAADCPYLHKVHAAGAPVCRAFLHSYCPRGASCPALHLTAKMARERARLLTTGGGGGSAVVAAVAPSGAQGAYPSGKRRLSDGGSRAGVSAARGAGSAAALLFAGVALQAPKRRRGGFRYFDADLEEPDAAAAAAAEVHDPGEALSSGNGGRGASWGTAATASRPAASSSSVPAGSGRQGTITVSGVGGAAAAGKVDGGGGNADDDDGDVGIGDGCSGDGGPMLLPGGMMLYL